MSASAERVSTLFEFLPIGAYRSRPDGRVLRANAALVRLNGYDSEAQLLAAIGDLAVEWYVDPQRRAEFVATLQADGRVLSFESQVRRHRIGEIIWISENAHVVRNAAGEIAFFEGTVEDITLRRQTEHELRETGERWKRALESTGDGVWDWRIDAQIEILSPQCKALYGYGADELADLPEVLDSMTHPDDIAQMRRDQQDHLSGRTPVYHNEHRVRCRDGQWKWILSRGVVIDRDASGRPLRMIGTHTDINAAKQGQSLRQERDRAAAADQAKTQLLSRVSHELRTPLNAILGFSQLLQIDLAGQPRQSAWLGHVLSSGRHLLALVDDLLDLSSAQSGRLPLGLQPVPVYAAVQEAVQMSLPDARDAQVAVHNDIEQGLELELLADGRRLTQILCNLLSNAIKYNRPGGWVRVRAQRVGDAVEVSVADSGIGLDAARLSRLFQPFDRLGAELSGVPGHGLGLSVSRQLAEAMNGNIEAESEAGVGSVFQLRLPAA